MSDSALSLDEIPGPETGHAHEIQTFDVAADGVLSKGRLFCHTDHGYPDDFAIDARGWVWTTAADGMHVIMPDRTRLCYVPAPAVCSNCAFGGPDMTRLFIAATEYLLAIDLISAGAA